MSLTIKKLNCRVTVRTGERGQTGALRSEARAKPTMAFASPEAFAPTGTPSAPQHTASGQAERHENGAAQTPTPASPRRANARAVADRVYDLMRNEARKTRRN